MKALSMYIAALFLLSGCAGSKNDLSLGTFYGTLPCADCEGIAYALTLERDSTYSEQLVYQGKSTEVERREGPFTVDATGMLTLTDKEETEGMRQFLYKTDSLRVLDLSGKVVRGDLRDRYVLTRKKPADFSLDVQKPAESVDFKATGNEPSWVLTIDFDQQMEFKSLDGSGIHLVTPVPKQMSPQDDGTLRFNTQTDAGQLQVTLSQRLCTDTMSGEEFNYEVRVTVQTTTMQNAREYNGCGDYLGMSRLNAEWELTNLNGERLSNTEKVPNLRFNVQDGKVTGFAGCNRFTGAVMVTSHELTFGTLATTKMACPSLSLESSFLKALGSGAFQYSISGENLSLRNDAHTLNFQKQKP
jgi:heat shock protein HslJ/uncharacterized membrane protein